jgi:hypothetical protein
MWHALKAELAYFRIWLVGAFGIALGITVMLYVLKWLFDDGEGVPVFVNNMFLLIATMVVAFVALGMRVEERRSLLLMAGPMTPTQAAGVLVLLPACLMAVGLVITAVMMGATALIAGRIDPEGARVTASLAGEFWAAAQLGPLAQESSAARRQGRNRAGLLGWILFAAIILALIGMMFLRGSIPGLLGHLTVIGAAMAAALMLYRGRTDFTR